MTSKSPRIYLYKITFEEVPYYYYGVKKEKYFNEEYWGTPKTNKWCWELYAPKKQILQLFDFTDKGWLEALEVEKRLIKPFYNIDKWCLNESCGGVVSLEINRETGRKMYEMKIGFHKFSKEERNEASKKGGYITGRKMRDERKGIFALTEEEWLGNRIKAGSISGKKLKEESKGIFGLTEEEKRYNAVLGGKSAAKITNSQKWECCETGYASTAAGVVSHQKSKGIDTSKSNRKRIE